MLYASNNNHIPTGGRLGNQLMRIMSLMGLAAKYNTTWAIPDWEYAKYFENDIPQKNIKVAIKITELNFHYTPEFWDKIDWTKNVDIKGFLQSYKYWGERLSFKKGYLSGLRHKYDFSKPVIAISVRRGDMINNPNYFQLSPMYYIKALYKFFPDYRERGIFIFSDDMSFCRALFGSFKNVTYIDGSDIEQLAVLTLCDDFIISQSTFAYIGAYLAGRGKVIRPVKNFAGMLALKNREDDYWVPSWVSFDESAA
jgi:hypothetical protein